MFATRGVRAVSARQLPKIALSSTIRVAGVAFLTPRHNSTSSHSGTDKSRPSSTFIAGAAAAFAAGAALFAFNSINNTIHNDSPTIPELPVKSEGEVKACLHDLKVGLPPGRVSTDPTLLKARSKDPSIHEGNEPFAVVFCHSEAEVVSALKILNAHKMPVIPHASLTSLEGQTTPTKMRGVVVDVGQMNATVEIHEADMQATLQAGKSWNDLNEELAPLGLMFGPDPGLGASMSGMCATSCSGTRAWRYGTMKENVVGMRVVLATGEVITTRRRPNKSSAGYDLTRLMIGTEGTIGIITEVTVKLHRIPEQLSVAMFSFPNVESASKCVYDIVRSGLSINRLELMDENAIKGGNKFAGLSYPETPMLLVEYAGSPVVIAEQKERVENMAANHGVLFQRSAKDDVEYEQIWDLRRNLT